MNPQMIKKIQKMQRDMQEAQKQIEETVFEGSSAGVVTVEIYGSKEVKKININREAIESLDDLDMIEDIIVAALNDAMNKVDEHTAKVMSQFTGGMGGFGF